MYLWLSLTLHELKDLVIEHGGSAILVILGSTVTFLLGKAREAAFVSVHKQLRKASQLRPGTALGHQAVNQELHDLRRDLDVTRVCIHQFHNGDNFMLSNHSWKVSCTHEALDPVARPTFKESQSLPISHLVELVGPVVDTSLTTRGVEVWKAPACGKQHATVFYDLSAMEASAIKIQLTEQGTSFLTVVSLVDPGRRVTFGFIALHLQECCDAKRMELRAKLSRLESAADRIQYHLSDDFRAFDRPRGWRRCFRFLAGGQ